MKFDRTIFPVIADKIEFDYPVYSLTNLKNRSPLYFVKKDKLPIVQIQLLFNAGSNFDPDGKNGLANLFSALIDEGAGGMSALQISERLEQLGTTIRISCNHDFILFNLLCLKEKFEESLMVLNSILNQPHFDEKDFKRELNRIKLSLRQYGDDPEIIADIFFEKILFDGAGLYNHFPTGLSSNLDAIQLKDIKKFYVETFCNAELAILSAGNLTEVELSAALEKLFDFHKKNITSIHLNNELHSRKKIFIHHKENSPQTEIRFGLRVDKRNEINFMPRTILNFIFGGQFSSRLNLNLREKRGLTYGIRSSYNHFKRAAYFQIAASVDVENIGVALNEIANEKNRLIETLTDEEIKFAKDSMIRKFPLGFETYSQIVSWLGSAYVFDLPENYLEGFSDRVYSVGRNELSAIYEKDFLADELIILVGDAEKVRKSLDENNIYKGEVVVQQCEL